MRRLILRTITATMALCLFGPAVPALAAPDGSQVGTATFPLVCDGELSTLTVGGGPWSAAHIAESGKTFVPVSTTLSMRDAQTYELLYEEHDAKGKSRGGPVRCVDEFLVDGVLITFTVHGHLH
jgi:hypothetical protein